MSGRATVQQGLATTCKDRTTKGQPRRAEGDGLTHERQPDVAGGFLNAEIQLVRCQTIPLLTQDTALLVEAEDVL